MNKKGKIEKNISLKLETIDDMFSPYSEENNLMIKPEIVTHIENCIDDIKRNSDVVIHIKTPYEVSEQSVRDCNKAFKNYYRIKQEDDKKEINKMLLVSFALLLIGIAITIGQYFLMKADVHFVLQLLTEIIGWAFVWEFVHICFFQCSVKRVNLKFNTLMLNAKLIFNEKENKK